MENKIFTAPIMDQFAGVVEVLLSERFSLYRNVAAVIGAGYLLRILVRELFSLASDFRAYFLAPCGVSRVKLTQYGSWAGE